MSTTAGSENEKGQTAVRGAHARFTNRRGAPLRTQLIRPLSIMPLSMLSEGVPTACTTIEEVRPVLAMPGRRTRARAGVGAVAGPHRAPDPVWQLQYPQAGGAVARGAGLWRRCHDGSWRTSAAHSPVAWARSRSSSRRTASRSRGTRCCAHSQRRDGAHGRNWRDGLLGTRLTGRLSDDKRMALWDPGDA